MRELLIGKVLAMYPLAISVIELQQLVDGISPGRWNAIVPIGATPKQAVILIVDQALSQGWSSKIIDALEANAPNDKDVQALKKWATRPPDPLDPNQTTATSLAAIRRQMLVASDHELERLRDETDVLQARLLRSGSPAEIAEARALHRQITVALQPTMGGISDAPNERAYMGSPSRRWLGATVAAVTSLALAIVIWRFHWGPGSDPTIDAGVVHPPQDAGPPPSDSPTPIDSSPLIDTPTPLDTQAPIDSTPPSDSHPVPKKYRCYYDAGAFSYATSASACRASCPASSGERKKALVAEALSAAKRCFEICDCVPQ